MTTQTRSILAVALAAFALACTDAATAPSKFVSNAPTATITQQDFTFPPGFPDGLAAGVVRLCKTANHGGTFSFTVTANGNPVSTPSIVIPTGGGTSCQDVFTSSLPIDVVDNVTITEGADPGPEWDLTAINTIRYLATGPLNGGAYPAAAFTDVEEFNNRRAIVRVNLDMSRKVTFTNTFTQPEEPPPPPAICDFITFGRLVDEAAGGKVVISGNAGGLNANGSIKGEFHIEVNGVDHHVADVTTYGPITNNPLISSTFTNSRVVTGTDKHGHAVELRLWDGGEPGKDTDRYWFNVNGLIVGNAVTGNLIDQGNMQYHPNCRGPGD